MDRLPALTVPLAVLLATLSCEDRPGTPAPPPASRVNAVMATQPRGDALAAFCDVRPRAGAAPAFSLPPLAEGTASRAAGWHWVNLWATWCHPCVEEMPLLPRFAQRLAAGGTPVTVEFLSVDANSEDVRGFRATHPGLPPSMRITNPDLLPGWLTSLGLDAGATIPIHVFVDPSHRVRCVRAGAVGEESYDTLRQLVRAR